MTAVAGERRVGIRLKTSGAFNGHVVFPAVCYNAVEQALRQG
ncbi:MAG: hypothetical protein LZF86_100188 [Nitrospira sp.]|nr:MAG: hypothetical protein LZF86_100188 [Nitrospira sp.]